MEQVRDLVVVVLVQQGAIFLSTGLHHIGEESALAPNLFLLRHLALGHILRHRTEQGARPAIALLGLARSVLRCSRLVLIWRRVVFLIRFLIEVEELAHLVQLEEVVVIALFEQRRVQIPLVARIETLLLSFEFDTIMRVSLFLLLAEQEVHGEFELSDFVDRHARLLPRLLLVITLDPAHIRGLSVVQRRTLLVVAHRESFDATRNCFAELASLTHILVSIVNVAKARV